uniref:Tr-type G domain-containing protein n=1 Tax=Spongospora subterranea TaxID=70186 RepID=A0A0H5QJS1_9EUKA|eukprot:CRZ01877.1 hypothetical protein [Spongospora subterranea]
MNQEEQSEGFFGQVVPSSNKARRKHQRGTSSEEVLQNIKHIEQENGLILITDPANISLSCTDETVQQHLGLEDDGGCIEFKYVLFDVSDDRLDHLCTQMNYRLSEGCGQAIYEIGIRDNGEPTGLNNSELKSSICTIHLLSSILSCDCFLVHVRRGISGKTAQLLIRRTSREQIRDDVRVCILGLSGSGKSSLVGVISSGSLDNGNGSARTNVFRHQHELVNGRTSCLARQVIGFSQNGNICNHSCLSRTMQSVVNDSARLVTLVDLAGLNSRYAKITLAGLASQVPDYCCVAISSVCALDVFEKHVSSVNLSVQLRFPVYLVLTKADILPDQSSLEKLIATISSLVPLPIVLINDEQDLSHVVESCLALEQIPIFVTSAVSGYGLETLKDFMMKLRKSCSFQELRHQPAEFTCNEVHVLRGPITVLSGIVLTGIFSVGQIVNFGPMPDKTFRSGRIESIHVLRVATQSARAGQAASIVLADVSKDEVRRGIAVLDTSLPCRTCCEFVATLKSNSPVQPGMQFVVHVGSVSQLCSVSSVSETGDTIRLRFQQRAEYVPLGSRFIFRDTKIQACGIVTNCIPIEDPIL